MELDAYARALGAAQSLVPSYNQLRLQGMQLQGAELDNQYRQQQIAGLEQEQQQRQAMTDAFAGLGANPTPQQYRQLAARFPQYAAGLSNAANSMESSVRQQKVAETARIFSAISNGQPEIAAGIIQRHIDADVKAGAQPDPEDQGLLDALKSGDPSKIAAAKGMLYGVLTSFDPDSAAKNLGEYGGSADDKRYVVGRALVDQAGKPLYRDPEPERAPTYREIEVQGPDGVVRKTIVALGGSSEGGGQASGSTGAPSGSGAPSGRYQYGWTPRARNGGDNSDAAVDNKISGMASALGISATTPFPPDMSNVQIAQALALSEGGKGSIADRNNNPGNIRDPRTGEYRKFASKDAGIAAAAAQVARNRARGQNTIQSMVEGVPVGGTRNATTQGVTPVFQGAPVERPTAKPSETRVLNGRVYQKINGQWFAQGGA